MGLRIVFHSNAPWSPVGYGQQCSIFTPRFRDAGHNVAISAFWGLGGAMLDWEGMHVYPGDDRWGNRTLGRIAKEEQADLVITLMDVWSLLESAEHFASLPLACWVPVDHDPVPPKVVAFFEQSGARPIAMSKFGARALRECGLDPLYVPHGIDTNLFRPRPEARAEVREVVGIPDDAFVVGMVAANKGCTPPRKAFPQVFEAFARLQREHPDAYLYLHTDLAGVAGGVNLGHLAKMHDIPSEAVKATPPWRYEIGVDPENIACLIEGFDVLANPSYGEGFGIPIVEAQACGKPVIVTDWTSMPELCGAGWLVGGDRFYDPTQGSFYRSPSVDELHAAMQEAYERRGDQEMATRAREFALGYDAAHVMEDYWKPALEELGKVPVPEQPSEPEVFVKPADAEALAA